MNFATTTTDTSATWGTTSAPPQWSNSTTLTLAELGIKLLELKRAPTRRRLAQLAELERLAIAGRRLVSLRERARFGWRDAPRRPCYRAPRVR